MLNGMKNRKREKEYGVRPRRSKVQQVILREREIIKEVKDLDR